MLIRPCDVHTPSGRRDTHALQQGQRAGPRERTLVHGKELELVSCTKFHQGRHSLVELGHVDDHYP